MANTTVTNLWGTAQAITMTLASLATDNNAGRESSMITSSGYTDGMLHLKFGIGTGGNATTNGIQLYAYKGSSIDGADLTDPATGTDAAITFNYAASPGTATNMTYIGRVNVVATATHYDFHIISLAQVFGGNMPPAWGIVVNNAGGSTFTGTEAAFTKEWLPLTVQAG